MKQRLQNLALGVLAGIMIGLGGLAYVACLSCETTGLGKIAGSVLFSCGLLAVCSLGLFLYTGKIGYVFQKKPGYLLDLLFGYIGNVIGALFIGFVVYKVNGYTMSGIGATLDNIASSRELFVSGGEKWWDAILLSFICGILVFIAVDIFKKKPGVIGSLALILAVTVFVVVGSEHTIANMFYFSAAGKWSVGAFLNILFTTIGNSLGAIFFERLLYLGGLYTSKEETTPKKLG